MELFNKYKHYRKYISRTFCLSYLLSRFFYRLHLSKCSIFFNDTFNQGLQKYLKNRYLTVIRKAGNEVKQFNAEKSDLDGSVFVCWFQGMEKAPELVKSCYSALTKNAGKHKVVLLTDDNVFDIVKLPDHVLQKYKDGKITKTHITNLIRTSLLYLYGGLWIDSTIFTSEPLSEEIFTLPFYTIKRNPSSKYYIPKGRWTSYFMAGKKGCPYGHIVRSVLFEYWKEHDELIDYFMYDQIINLCYENSDVVKQLIDSVPQNNPNVDFFKNRYNESFDKEEWEKVTKSTSVFKLSYKEQIDETKMNTYYTTVVTPPPYLNKRIVKISCPRFLGILKEAA